MEILFGIATLMNMIGMVIYQMKGNTLGVITDGIYAVIMVILFGIEIIKKEIRNR